MFLPTYLCVYIFIYFVCMVHVRHSVKWWWSVSFQFNMCDDDDGVCIRVYVVLYFIYCRTEISVCDAAAAECMCNFLSKQTMKIHTAYLSSWFCRCRLDLAMYSCMSVLVVGWLAGWFSHCFASCTVYVLCYWSFFVHVHVCVIVSIQWMKNKCNILNNTSQFVFECFLFIEHYFRL